MQTETTRVVLRLRTPWEAVDLGISMVRSWWLPILASWLALFVPVVLAAWLLAPSTTVALVVIWWLKPLFDRVVLNVLAQGVFGPLPRWSDTLSALPALLLRSGLLLSLLPLRFSPHRSLTLPILQLESLRGRAYGHRGRTLSGRDGTTAIGFTVLCSGFELLLIFTASLLGAVVLGDPFQTQIDLDDWLTTLNTPHWLVGLYALTLTLVEPFYVGGGFGLYLNRRIELEGWDIEVAFRAIARRHRQRSAALRSAVLIGALTLGAGSLLGATLPARAAEPLRCESARPAAATECIARVLGMPEFERQQEQGGWRLRRWVRELFGDDDRDDERSESGIWLGELLAASLKVLAWVALVFGGLALTGVLARHVASRRRPEAAPGAAISPGETEAALELPADVVGAALARWSVDPVAALGLLYAGARADVIARLELALPCGATERECERAARRRAHGALVDDFGALTRAWIHCAYAERLPSADSFRGLCERWRTHLASA